MQCGPGDTTISPECHLVTESCEAPIIDGVTITNKGHPNADVWDVWYKAYLHVENDEPVRRMIDDKRNTTWEYTNDWYTDMTYSVRAQYGYYDFDTVLGAIKASTITNGQILLGSSGSTVVASSLKSHGFNVVKYTSPAADPSLYGEDAIGENDALRQTPLLPQKNPSSIRQTAFICH